MVKVDSRFALPDKLPQLLADYKSRHQEPVRYRPSTWREALCKIPGDPTALLTRPDISAPASSERFRSNGDREITRERLAEVCAGIDLEDESAVIQAFVLVMAWGSGTTNGRSLRNTRRALEEPLATKRLRESAEQFRVATAFTDVIEAYRGFKLPGIGEAFATKWFAFAGRKPGRDWQPLILDSLVRVTLNKTLDVWLNQLAQRRSDPYRYIAYVEAMHLWAAHPDISVNPERLEWICFDNGRRIKQPRGVKLVRGD